MVRRHTGTIDLANHRALSRRLFPDLKDDCNDDTPAGSQKQPIKEKAVQKQPVQTLPATEKPPLTNSPPQKQPLPSKQPVNTSVAPVSVPATLAFGKVFHGDATYYGSAGGGGACGFGNFKATLPGIAIGAHIFGQGEACGACVELDPGSHGKPVVVQVDNKCPECNDGADCESFTSEKAV